MRVIEPWSVADLDEVCDLLNASSRYDRFTKDQLRESVFEDPDARSHLVLCSRADGRIVGVAAGVARVATAERTERGGFIKLLAVAPEARRQGHGAALLAAVEARLAATGVKSIRVFADSPSHLVPGVDFRLTDLVCLLYRHGYESQYGVVNMAVDLAAAPLDTAAEERRLIGADVEVHRLARHEVEAFGAYLAKEWHWEWTIEPLRSLRRDPVSCFVATVHGEHVGFAAYDLAGPTSFGPMGVRPDLRRYGIGGVLLKRCLADMRAKGYSTADIQWVDPIPFYNRQVGATISRCFLQLGKRLTE
jgi:GNAT superfamily N-acetyltransferase